MSRGLLLAMKESKRTVSSLRDLQRHGRPVSTSVHEAAHAYAAHLLGFLPVRVTVRRDDGAGYLGRLWYTPRPADWRGLALVALAGPIAESLLELGRVHELYGDEDDYKLVRSLVATHAAGSERELERLQDEAIAFVTANRRPIRHLAIVLAEQGELEHEQLTAALAAAQKENECL